MGVLLLLEGNLEPAPVLDEADKGEGAPELLVATGAASDELLVPGRFPRKLLLLFPIAGTVP